MLVLSRKLGEKIVIGDSITITVVDIERDKIRLGIEAPRSVPVLRQELYDAMHPSASEPESQRPGQVALEALGVIAAVAMIGVALAALIACAVLSGGK